MAHQDARERQVRVRARVRAAELQALRLGRVEYIGKRIAALRLRLEYARFTGASKPGTSRL